MEQSNLVEVFGTVTAPALTPLIDGAPRLQVKLKSAEQTITQWSAQVSHPPMRFRLWLDRTLLRDDETLTLEAVHTRVTGDEKPLATHSQPLPNDVAGQVGPLDIVLDGNTDTLAEQVTSPGQADIVELSGTVKIPSEAILSEARLSIILLVVQSDGDSNLYSSSIAGVALPRFGSEAPFSLTLDKAVIPDGHAVKLSVGIYSADGQTIHAGRVIKNVDLSKDASLGDIVLRLAPN